MKRSEVAPGLANREAPHYDLTTPVSGPPLASRRVSLISTAGLMHRGDTPFTLGETGFRFIDTDSAQPLLMSHVSTNFDRSGFVRDSNVVLPLERLREKAAAGEIGSVAKHHYSFMGATSPEAMAEAADQVATKLLDDEVDALILAPV